jgi:2,3-bisphosphoglycerate-dependent phosphoglycerate mutase
MRILLVRHGESEANVDRSVHTRLPDHAIPLSDRGRAQADAAGVFLAKWLAYGGAGYTYQFGDVSRNLSPGLHVGSGKLPFRLWQSPYLRARQTAEIILAAVKRETGAVPEFGVREHVNLAEQQFGLFDGLSDEDRKERYPAEQGHFQKCEDFEGEFWARMPLGESRFDVALRVHQAFGTFHRDAEKHRIDTIVVVAHGTTNRAFLMQWLHLPFEWFEQERNPKNCSIRYIADREDVGYIYPGEGA